MASFDWELQDQLVTATEEGPVAQWCDRLASLYKKAGGQVAQINWNKAPLYVAGDIVEGATCGGLLPRLRQVLVEYVGTKKSAP